MSTWVWSSANSDNLQQGRADCWRSFFLLLYCSTTKGSIAIRDGVEDTRLEAKDTKKSEAKDIPSEDRYSRGQGQECSRPRPRTKDQGQRGSDLRQKKVFAPKIRKFSGKFRRSPKKKSSLPNFVNFPENSSVPQELNVFKIFFASSLAFFKTKQNWSWPWPIFNKSKISAVLDPRTGHFRGLASSQAKNFKLCSRGLQLW